VTFSSPQEIPIFLAENGISKVIAFSGGGTIVPANLDNDTRKVLKDASLLLQKRTIEDCLQRLCFYKKHIAVLTGGTEWGVPAMASRVASEHGFSTIGIFPETGASKALDADILDLRVCVNTTKEFSNHSPEQASKFGSDWGDESPLFCKTLDAVVVLGGRAGTLVEIAHVLKVNERRKKYNRPPKLIIPVMASGGSAEATSYLPADPEVRAWCMPDNVIRTGQDTGEYLEEKLQLHDLLGLQLTQTSKERIEK